MKWLRILPLFLIITACHKKPETVNTAKEPAPTPAQKPLEKQSDFSKLLRESIYFANSLEREALKLITKDSSFQRLTLFSVLSFVVETSSGAKKSTPLGLDCGTYTVKRVGRDISILKSCSRPFAEIAHIQIVRESEKEAEYAVDFTINEWASVLGMAVTLTGSNVRCQLTVKDARLNRMNCDNWSFLISESHLSATVVKTKVFLFERDAEKQFVIKGGFFKELIENKKIDIVVPLEGKIKIIEKEIRVIDEFAIKKEEKVEKETPEISKEEYEKVLKENEQGQKSEAVSEDSSQAESQSESEVQSSDSTESEAVPGPRTRGGR
jgi:hypothetical protein